MTLTTEQVSKLLQSHCLRVIDRMDEDELVSYAIKMMSQSFNQKWGEGDTDVPMLIQDIWIAEGEDDDSTSDFIGAIVGDELAEEIMKTTQFWNWHQRHPEDPRVPLYWTSQPITPDMDFDTFDTDFWNEIQDAPGEIFDIDEMMEDEQTWNEFVNSNVTVW